MGTIRCVLPSPVQSGFFTAPVVGSVFNFFLRHLPFLLENHCYCCCRCLLYFGVEASLALAEMSGQNGYSWGLGALFGAFVLRLPGVCHSLAALVKHHETVSVSTSVSRHLARNLFAAF